MSNCDKDEPDVRREGRRRAGRNWKGPIKEFHLTVRKEHDDERMRSCFSPEIAKSGDEYEVRIRDFVPRREFKVYFLGPNAPRP